MMGEVASAPALYLAHLCLQSCWLYGARHIAETKMGEIKILPHIRDMVTRSRTETRYWC